MEMVRQYFYEETSNNETKSFSNNVTSLSRIKQTVRKFLLQKKIENNSKNSKYLNNKNLSDKKEFIKN